MRTKEKGGQIKRAPQCGAPQDFGRDSVGRILSCLVYPSEPLGPGEPVGSGLRFRAGPRLVLCDSPLVAGPGCCLEPKLSAFPRPAACFLPRLAVSVVSERLR